MVRQHLLISGYISHEAIFLLLESWKVAISRQSAWKIMCNPMGSVRSEALRDVESIGIYLIQRNRLAIEMHICPLHVLQMGSASSLSASAIDSMTTIAYCYSCKERHQAFASQSTLYGCSRLSCTGSRLQRQNLYRCYSARPYSLPVNSARIQLQPCVARGCPEACCDATFWQPFLVGEKGSQVLIGEWFLGKSSHYSYPMYFSTLRANWVLVGRIM